MTSNLAVDKRKGEKIECACRECNRSTLHDIITDAILTGSDGSEIHEISWASEYHIVQCMGCESLSFRRASSNSDDGYIEVAPNQWEENIHEELFPTPYKGRRGLADSNLLSDKIERIYLESLAALNNQHAVLCGIGVRAIVETVCKDKCAAGKNLYDKINSLVTLGVLTQDGANILHKLRVLGNNAAHEVIPHSPKELGLAFDVVDHLLLGVYILPTHAKRTFK